VLLGIPAAALAGAPLQAGLLAGGWDDALEGAGGPWDLTVVLLARLWPHVERHLGGGPVVLDYVDALGEGARHASRMDPALWRRLYWTFEAPRLERLEARAAGRCALLLASAPADAARLPEGTRCVPLGVELGPAGAASRGPVVAFSGRLRYRPNEIAVKRLVSSIWPHVVAKCPGAELAIGGADAPRWLRSLPPSARIRVTTPVGDMPSFLRAARVVVAPVALGSGSQLKVWEAMEAGAAVVTSPEVAARSGAAAPLPVRVATTDEEYAGAILGWLGDPEGAARDGGAGRDWVARHADRERFTRDLADCLRKAAA
jgi:glycosyltransferase involved in cell wall biosynthesis